MYGEQIIPTVDCSYSKTLSKLKDGESLYSRDQQLQLRGYNNTASNELITAT